MTQNKFCQNFTPNFKNIIDFKYFLFKIDKRNFEKVIFKHFQQTVVLTVSTKWPYFDPKYVHQRVKFA